MLTSSRSLRQLKEKEFEEWPLEDWDLSLILVSKREDSGLEGRKEFTNSAKIIGMISRGQSTGKVAGILTVKYEGLKAMSQL